jgi:hyaluronoglucosaminidase
MLSLGVIEGFYGKVWTWAERKTMLDFLARQHFSSYWYAPKADACLRKHWSENWNTTEFDALAELSAYAAQQHIQFGIGLSPLGLYTEWREGAGRDKLLQRLQQIAALKPQGLALLFDDMQGDLPGLAQTQADIAHFVADNIDVKQLILCPSYYSFDPILEQLFGKMPDNYWQDLGALLDTSIDIFWTGDKVISQEYPRQGLQKITEAFQRKPVIWDNSIVNDGRKTSPFLTVRAMFSAGDLAQDVNGIIVNPMNAPALSQIPLLSLTLTGTPDLRFLQALHQEAPELESAILNHLALFNEKGRENLTPEDIAQLNDCFRVEISPIAQNIIAWLEGAYQFDPACLT